MECVRDGRVVRFRAQREVVLSTGGFNTPKLLMLSGIGDRSELRALNIPVRVHSPEVGKNVQDHILHGGCLFEAPEPFEYRNSAANVSGYLKTDPSFELPDVSLVQIELPYTSEVIAQQFPPPPNTWALCGGLVAPKSRGTVRLRSANPADRPIVDMRSSATPTTWPPWSAASNWPATSARPHRDSTIMPRIVAVPTMPACVLIGLRLAELLGGRDS